MSEDTRGRRLRAQTTFVSAAVGLIVATTALALLFFARPLVSARWGRSATDWLGALLLAVQVGSAAAGWWAATELGGEPQVSTIPPLPGPVPDRGEPEPPPEPLRAEDVRQPRVDAPVAVLPLAERVVVIPLGGSIDREQLVAVQRDLLHEIERREARVALVDLTAGVEMTAQAVDAFEQLLRAMRLIGCQVVVTGVRGQVARALLETTFDVHMETRRDLRAGLAYALSLAAQEAQQTAPPAH